MNTLHLKDIDWKQYLSTLPTDNPTHWASDILNAFKKGYIDYFDAHLALQRYESENAEYSKIVGAYYKMVQKEERNQDMNRARIYKEQNRK